MRNTFTTGLMSSGKSKVLIENYNRGIDQSKAKCSLSISIDQLTGYTGKIESRNGDSIESIILNMDDYSSNLKLILDLIKRKHKVIFIDEVQFMNKEFVHILLKLSMNYNVEFRFYGLLTTFTGSYFESSKFLMENINEKDIQILEMICQHENCNMTATNNARIINDQIVRDGETFVEQKSKYMSLCKKHYFS
ncbi:thymidine kinase [Staphylococcus equorum]|uniref:thymidine kinase n=1 Tax=Staphylococcus equorum TaxID=246432 RepID=A0A9X4R2Q0_9STAP|nr:thymidine kinase [Staphylococcus equorum]MDG0860351.1 thymidine kinase [Staphylococcus equorum]